MPDLGAEDFRRVLGHFLTGVTIVTTVDSDGQAVGLTANAFMSVSLEPPLVLVCVARSAASFAAMETAESYAVHLLHEDQGAISSAFARSAADGAQKFVGVEWRPGQRGEPLLDDSLGRLECDVVDRFEMGDHVGYLGRVHTAQAAEEGQRAPLGFFRGAYARLAG